MILKTSVLTRTAAPHPAAADVEDLIYLIRLYPPALKKKREIYAVGSTKGKKYASSLCKVLPDGKA